MIYFTLPNFFEYAEVNAFIISLARSAPQVFKEPITFIQTSGNFAYNYWTGSYCNMVGPGAYHKDFTTAANRGVPAPLRLLCDNVALEKDDYVNVMNSNILEANNTGSGVIEVSNIELMDYITEKYPNRFKFVFSKQADLITPFTPDLINQVIDFDKFQFIGIPDRLNGDFDFLRSIKNRSKLEITVNPRCPANCRSYEKCHIEQHLNQLNFSMIDNITTCRNNSINKNIITLEKIKEDYLPLGINHFTFAQQNANLLSEIDIISFYLFYFIKEEHQFPYLLQWNKFREELRRNEQYGR